MPSILSDTRDALMTRWWHKDQQRAFGIFVRALNYHIVRISMFLMQALGLKILNISTYREDESLNILSQNMSKRVLVRLHSWKKKLACENVRDEFTREFASIGFYLVSVHLNQRYESTDSPIFASCARLFPCRNFPHKKDPRQVHWKTGRRLISVAIKSMQPIVFYFFFFFNVKYLICIYRRSYERDMQNKSYWTLRLKVSEHY